MAPLRLQHLHLPSIHPHYVPYSLANRVQELLRRQHLDFKDSLSSSSSASNASPPPSPPPPTLISFTPAPIFTLGRRQTAPLTPAEAARLTAPLLISPLSSPSPSPSTPSAPSAQLTNDASTSSNSTGAISTTPRLLHSPRGGLTTYHGPGQVVLWPILDLHPLHGAYRTFSVKCYARLLEETTIGTLGKGFGIEAFTTEDPGVWVRRLQQQQQHQRDREERDREDGLAKIAALGVHLRRHITALGTALNVDMPGPEDVNERTNPWARFVACGLTGRGVTSIVDELAARGGQSVDRLLRLRQGAGGHQGQSTREAEVAGVWAGELARHIGLEEGDEGVEVAGKGEVIRLMEGLLADAVGEHDELQEERSYLERIKEAH
ncbi:uncharacterized protein C8A04DRAFT_10960 [Dichotomopilus funicola]|uniref:BPL/LPL catalytic domain-containing protein n=1 Tax=Dichotomopilus funicola TaxID=1934379 RepID=A0AAN6V572_9PEZI|nr:hypothetical protein C8A04DRAFT_10960 [Dichotomopilus funicola]